MKGFGTDEATLIRVLGPLRDAGQVALIRNTYNARFAPRDLIKDIKGETSGNFEYALLAILRGPLGQDAWVVDDAIRGAGTKEDQLNDVLCGRSNADLRAIKGEYERVFRKNLDKEVAEDLSGNTQRLFSMILAANRAEESAPVIPQQVEQDITELHRATDGGRTDPVTVSAIISSRSDGQLRTLAHAFQQKYHKALDAVLKDNLHGHIHLRDALLQILHGATDKAMRDAMSLEACMAGPGTRDHKLINRVMAIHWDPPHMDQVRRAYEHKYKKSLKSRIEGETSGDYRKLLVACIQ